MGEARIYSERLGAITDTQLAAAAERLGLGAFVSAEPVHGGLHGQNLFLTTGAGAFVLRGAPHWVPAEPGAAGRFRRDDRVQFAAELYFINQLREHTNGPVPWPTRYDPTSDIFGWPYLVMPRLPGVSLDIFALRGALTPAQRRQAATSMGRTLADLQRLTAPQAGAYDVDLDAIAPDPGGYGAHLKRQLADVARNAGDEAVMTSHDRDWIDAIMASAVGAPARPVTFTHGDYKPDNTTLAEDDGGVWRVSGLFDFHTARFGDGAFDLVRPALFFDALHPALAEAFVGAWREAGGDGAGLAPWLPLYVACERIALWLGFVRADARPAWAEGLTFRGWAGRGVERMLALVGAAGK